jgi:uncharacterized membrane protein required for colicin V production
LTTLLIDLSILGTIAFCTWRGYKNGLIRGVFGVVSLIVSLLIANIAAQAYADEAKGMLMPFVSGIVDSTLTEMIEEGIEYQHLAHDHDIDDVDFGTAYTALRQIGLPEAAAVSIAEQALESAKQALENDVAGGVGTFLSDLIAERLSSALSFVAVFGVAFLLVAIIFAVIGNLVGVVFALPGLKLVDIIAGSVLGLLKGVIIVYTIAVIIRYFGLLAQTTLERTFFLNYLVNNNPIANMLGL